MVLKQRVHKLMVAFCNADIIHVMTFVLSVVLCICFITPWICRNGSRPIILLLYVLWLVFFALDVAYRKIPIYFFVSMLTYGIFLSIVFLYRLVGFSNIAIGNYFNHLLIFVTFLIGGFLCFCCNGKERKIMFYIMIAAIAINSFSNIVIINIYPDAMKAINTIYGSDYAKMNVAETQFYMAGIVACALLLLAIKNCKRIITFILYFTSLMIILLFELFIVPRANSLLMLILFIIAFIFIKIKLKYKIVLSIIVFASSLLLFLFSGQIANFLLQFRGNRFLERIASIFQFFSRGEATVGSLGERIELLFISAKSWIGTPFSFLFGIGDKTNYSDPFTTGIGGHSGFFDDLARYGLLGSAILLSSTIMYFKTIFSNQNLDKHNKLYVCVFVVVFFLYNIINNSFRIQIVTVLFVGISCASSFLLKESNFKEIKI